MTDGRAGTMPQDLSAVAAAVGGQVSGEGGRRFGGVSIDTRTLQPGDLFFAIRGERFDGHDFIGHAVAAGAAAVVVERGRGASAAQPGSRSALIEVESPLRALQQLAREVRRASGARVVAITGSAGKTTTKDVAALLLGSRFRVFKNRGNLNNHIGLPLSLVELRHRPEIAVVELGMNHPGEIRTLVSIAEPDVRVWTNVSEVHAEFFPSVEAIADAKAEILEQASEQHVLVANADDPRVMARVERFPGSVVTFGFGEAASVRAEDVRDEGLRGVEADVRTPVGSVRLRTPLSGRGNLMNVLAAIAVALHFGVPLTAVAELVAGLRPSPHRGELLELTGGIRVVDDTYNSNPAAVRQALDVLGIERGAGRRLAVLGEMLELGESATPLHESCGRHAAAAGIDVLVTVGGAPARAMREAAVAAGLAPDRALHVPSSAEAADVVRRLVEPGDLILVKGSRGIRTELVVERLRAELA